MAANRVKSISFKEDEKELLKYVEKQGNVSDYVKKLIKRDMDEGYKFTEDQEKAIIAIVKKYAPMVKDEDLKKDFDKEKLEALGQFENM